MSQHESLRTRFEQHKPKNELSKIDDVHINSNSNCSPYIVNFSIKNIKSNGPATNTAKFLTKLPIIPVLGDSGITGYLLIERFFPLVSESFESNVFISPNNCMTLSSCLISS